MCENYLNNRHKNCECFIYLLFETNFHIYMLFTITVVCEDNQRPKDGLIKSKTCYMAKVNIKTRSKWMCEYSNLKYIVG
jgi:hypothetical protein